MIPMTALFSSQLHLLEQQHAIADERFQRSALILEGSLAWQHELIEQFSMRFPKDSKFQLGGESIGSLDAIPVKQGKRLLGREVKLLVVTLSDDFDANSFNAALGALVGGGVLILLGNGSDVHPWLERHLALLPRLKQSSRNLINDLAYWQNQHQARESSNIYVEQNEAIEAIERVLTGHRKRPLVITADRGRGKSSALGLAAARIAASRPCRILVTAPSKAAVQPVFDFSQIEQSASSSIEFVSPDELIKSMPVCDLLFVDEAAAIPVPLLKTIVAHYHRLVISSTVHGYEGCGRGFSLKFLPWLQKERKGTKLHHMQQPIRWAQNDALEKWCAGAFLLQAELTPLANDAKFDSFDSKRWSFCSVATDDCSNNESILSEAFALLVNAHYQTSPNDLMLLLSSKTMTLYTMSYDGQVVGAVLLNREGDLSFDIVERVQLGQSRPPGNLAPVELANHLALSEPATQRCGRVMRIAVHPLLQSSGVGSDMLRRLRLQIGDQVDYLATSFGVTTELFRFWQSNQFVPLKLGSAKDKASGTYSLTLVLPTSKNSEHWLFQAKQQFSRNLVYQLRTVNRDIHPSLAWSLFSTSMIERSAALPSKLAILYSRGGNSLVSSRSDLFDFMVSLANASVDVESPIVTAVVLQEWSWEHVVHQLSLAGRKQAEAQFRLELCSLMERLQCKLT